MQSRTRGLGTYRSSMQRARVTPNSAGLLSPVHSCDAIMIPSDQPHDIVTNHLILIGVYIVYPGDVQANAGEDGLPARDRVCTDDWVHRGEIQVGVQGRAPWRHDFVSTGCDCRFENWLGAGCSQCLEERLIWRREAVITESISTGYVRSGNTRPTAHIQKPREYLLQRAVYLACGGN